MELKPKESEVAATVNQKTSSIDFVMGGKVIQSISYNQIARLVIRGLEAQPEGKILDNYDIDRVFKSFSFNNPNIEESKPESLFPDED